MPYSTKYIRIIIMDKTKIARTITDIFNGSITMILAPLITLLVSPLESRQKVLFISLYILIPALPYIILSGMGKISDYDFTKREERPLYFITLSLLFGIMLIVVKQFGFEQLTNVALCLFVVSSVITAITFSWKISGHMTYSTFLFCTLVYLFPSPYTYLLFIFLPLIAWTRVELKKHTFAQVIAGTLVTLAICILIYWVF